MSEHPERAPEIEPVPKPEPNVGWEEERGPFKALGCATGCLGFSGSVVALAVVAVAAVVALLLS